MDKPQLTNWNNEPSLAELRADLESSKGFHTAQMGKIRRWNDLMQATSDKRKGSVGRSKFQPKLVRRQAEWRYSALTEPFLGSEKLFDVSPVTFEDKAAAEQNALVLNWQFRTKLNRVKLIDDYVRTAVDEGTAILRVGWKRNSIMVQKEVPVFEYAAIESEEDMQVLQKAIELRTVNPREYDETAPEEMKASVDYYLESDIPVIASIVGSEIVDVEQIIENRPTVDVINPANIYIDPSCNGNFEEALFVIYAFETNKAELLKEGNRYKSIEDIDWENSGIYADTNYASQSYQSGFTFSDKARKKVVAYEYWGYYDINGDGSLQPIVATWIGDTLIRLELSPFPDRKLPFVLVTYSPVKREMYGEPDAELLEDNQKILGAVSRGMIDLLGRSANSQIGFAKGLLDPVNKKRYEAGDDYEFNPNMPPEAGIIHHKYPEIPQSAITMLQMQNMEAEALTGVKSFSGGLSGAAYGDVAAGIRGVLDAASKREMAILRRLAQGIVAVGNKIIAMNALFLSEEEVIRVTNTEFVTVKREDLAGNFDLTIDISTAEVDEAKAHDLTFMLQTLGNSVDPNITMMLLSEIAALKRMPELANKLKNYQPLPLTEQQQMMQQLEMKRMELEVAKLEADIQLARAKARNLSGKTDLDTLNYVEQESGTKHARELEKQAGQARGNQRLEVTKALLKGRKAGESEPNIAAAIGFNDV